MEGRSFPWVSRRNWLRIKEVQGMMSVVWRLISLCSFSPGVLQPPLRARNRIPGVLQMFLDQLENVTVLFQLRSYEC